MTGMREIKFRVWDADSKRMINLDGCKLYSSEDEVKLVMGCDFHDDMSDNEEITHFTLLQFTGLKDIENKDVYEGDIVQFLTFIGRGVVTYAPPQFQASGHSLKGYDFKIIGNIYEHPEIVIESVQ